MLQSAAGALERWNSSDYRMSNNLPSIPTVGILSAIAETEHPALLSAFGRRVDSPPDEIHDSQRYWFAELKNRDRTIRVVLSCIASSGNSDVPIPTERMIKRFCPELMLFVGIACGVEWPLADVVTSGWTCAYEYVKTTPEGDLDRSRMAVTPQHLKSDVAFFTAHEAWQRLAAATLGSFPPNRLPRLAIRPSLHPSVGIASGEKVMANGELASLHEKHNTIRAGEMEGFGFAKACDGNRPPVPWLVVRGLSDYGDPSKDGRSVENATREAPRKDEYHLAAAVSAATFAKVFLETSYDATAIAAPGTLQSAAAARTEHRSVGTLSDKQIAAMAANGLLISDEFNKANLHQACYELRAGDTYYSLAGNALPARIVNAKNILLKPRQLTVVITKETLNIPDDILGRVLTKGRLFSVGLLPVNTYADPGFTGKLGIVFYNATPQYLRIMPGDEIAKIEFAWLAESVERPYVGQHGYQTKIWPIPVEMIVPPDELATDPRVGSVAKELEHAYGPSIAGLIGRVDNARRLGIAAIVLTLLVGALVLAKG